ncbi:hypothetical protein RIF25_11185 [Thermosynechococcaceae cyanobacterium BACA0444]|uniref:DUF4164 domain-containing protein n=1 Tax=Pseudocalidococcus azoricus BACA0444 TaxID=2918990 RepID=A0AAE4JWT2_9CYAN|nr:hypothetical protein [Pseudocalidococcus azoricus]MDS3861371.1 hypothetical protein [Pseudocalidococcus azoricus BACA0444]
MSESITASEAKQILDAIQALTLEVKVSQARTDEQFNTLRAEVKAEINELRVEFKALSDKVDELSERQRVTDNRLWSFIVTLIVLLTGGLVKLTFFDKV